MAQYVSLAKRPRLEGIFGPLSQEVDASLRVIFQQVDASLLALTSHHGTGGVGREGPVLELRLYASGQLEIFGDVAVGDVQGNCVEFMVELRPGWFVGSTSGEPGWDVEATIDADCQHRTDHGGLETVFRSEVVHATDPEEAARALLDVAVELHRLGTTKPVSFWLDMARDAP